MILPATKFKKWPTANHHGDDDKMKTNFLLHSVTLMLCATFSFANADTIKAGDQLKLKSNLHPDLNKRLLYSMNYQLPNLIPVCSDITVNSVKKKEMTFEWKGVEYTYKYDKHIKKAGVTFQENMQAYFGKTCDEATMQSLSKKDKEGIRFGRPEVGMSRQGILFAMGRPPANVNPDLDAPMYTYWLNRFKRQIIEFDEKGIVSGIRL